MSNFKLVPGINHCTNAEYHADKDWLSSTSIKDFIKDPQKFYRVYIERSEEKESIGESVASDGTLAHSLVLEPEKFDEEYAVFDGWKKIGKEYDEFSSKNLDKHVVSKSQLKKVQSWVNSFNKLAPAKALISNGHAEYSLATELEGVKIKVRADYINLTNQYIVDIKTSSLPSDVESFKGAVKNYGYDISAALYLMAFEKFYNCEINNFYFIVLGKKDIQCQIYRLSDQTRIIGKSKILKALQQLKYCMETNDWTSCVSTNTINMDEYQIKEV